MARNALRLSQAVRAFGPGAMVDLPTRSVIIAGLEHWNVRFGSKTLSEPRLVQRLETFLKKEGRLEPSARLSLRTPPISTERPGNETGGIEAFIFPAWFVCETSEEDRGAGAPRRRRLVRWQDLDAKTRRTYEMEDGRKSKVTPIRFVGACPQGHVQDIDWRYTVHGATSCAEPMWMEERGTSASPADTSVVCGCNKRLTLQEAFLPGRLGMCRGERPWLLDRDPDRCVEQLKLLTRTATNTYFPQTYTVISLPTAEDELTALVNALLAELTQVETVDDLKQARRFNDRLKVALSGHDDVEVVDRLRRIREAALIEAGGSAKVAEFDVFASGRTDIGVDSPSSLLYARTLRRSDWQGSELGPDLSAIAALVAVHRLREVSCLYGFTRFESAPSVADEEMEDVYLAVRGAALSRDADWLPAIEQFGEGLFIQFDPDDFRRWLKRPEVEARTDELLAGHEQWVKRFAAHPPTWPGMDYILLHSLAHGLMAEIALDCGYPASSLKERVYAGIGEAGEAGRVDRLGILIYTATAGAQGTLGGLVGTAPRFSAILRSALERLAICSNDPICADHIPDGMSGDRSTHGAACHGCLLISETSCEMRNLFLDRRLLVATMAGGGAEFFP